MSGNIATLTLTDGALGDDDLSANGSDVDPDGAATPAAAPPVIVTPVPAPAFSLWAGDADAGDDDVLDMASLSFRPGRRLLIFCMQ